jgi:pimeloyl-ACP methyl ester carboxylesterase
MVSTKAEEIVVNSGNYKLFGRWLPAAQPVPGKKPLVVALHGGSFTSRYFDLQGFSLLDMARAAGVSILALDRPCYGKSVGLSSTDTTFALNGEILTRGIQEFWEAYGGDLPGIFIIGHSIGAAIALIVAGLPKRWPLLGIAISGLGLVCPDQIVDAWKSLPDLPSIALPPDIKRQVMFGPPSSYDVDARELCMTDDCVIPRPELMEIVFGWPNNFGSIASQVTVPVHYRHAQFDGLWEVSPKTISDLRAALWASPLVDAAIYPNTGHCIDFHHVGPALQLHQIAFAIECAQSTIGMRGGTLPRRAPVQNADARFATLDQS